MKHIIYRVDDRFIHGQVLEGWVNYLHIKDIMIVNDIIANDSIRASIYQSTLPSGSKFSVYTVNDFCEKKPYLKNKKKFTLILLGSVDDLLKIKETFSSNIYFNIGCVADITHEVCINDSLFLSLNDFQKLQILSENYDIYFHKVPWEKPVIFSNHKRA